MASRHQTIYEVNTRVLVSGLSGKLDRPATLDDVDDAWLDRAAALGFDWVWLMGVWQIGDEGRRLARSVGPLVEHCRKILPGMDIEDMTGSPYAIHDYRVHSDFGGDEALARLRGRLAERGIRLMLDFVPNHVAIDHPWVQDEPDFFIPGTTAQLLDRPTDFVEVGKRILAHGRDPHFPGWSDTLQLNYANPRLREAMSDLLLRVSKICDGLRCDMAMLVTREVFQQTWGARFGAWSREFWPDAIDQVKDGRPDFLFLAEVYWALEDRLCEMGFDMVYDKAFYDGLRGGLAHPLNDILKNSPRWLGRRLRFVENHDEPRAAEAFGREQHRAAAVLAAMAPGAFLLHDGQELGLKTKLPVQLGRRPDEPVDEDVRAFYERLMGLLQRPEVAEGEWFRLKPHAAWKGNATWSNFIAFLWSAAEDLFVVVNYGQIQGQCMIQLPGRFAGKKWLLKDHLGPRDYYRDGDRLTERGMYFDMPAWGVHAFSLVEREAGQPVPKRRPA